MRKNEMKSEIWHYSLGIYKGYTEDIKVAKRIINWKSVESCSIYHTPSMQIFAYDFLLPTKSYNRVARLLELPKRRKSHSKILQGQKLQLKKQRHPLKQRGAQVISSELTAVED